MKQTLDVLNRMETEGVIGRYAMSGAVAAFKYIEPAVTHDLDILVTFVAKSGLIDLAPIFSYLKALGFTAHEGEGIVIAGWPVQFIPVADNLDAEALADAEEITIDFPDKTVARARILKPEHLVAVALRTGRPKDYSRISEFIESKRLDLPKLCDVLVRHGLIALWQRFCVRFEIVDPCRK